MKISVSYWMFEGGLEGTLPVEDAMKQAKQLGFDAIELCIADKGVLTHEATPGLCSQIRRQANQIGIEISSVASGMSWFYPPSSNDPVIRKAIIDFTRRSLQITKWLKVDAYLFVPGAVDVFFLPDSEVIRYDVCYRRAKEAVRRLVPAVQRFGVNLCIENVWNKFLLSPLEMRQFIDQFRCKGVGVYFDVGNVMLTGYPHHWIQLLGTRIKRVHIKDFKRSIGTVDGFVDLGEGDVDFEAVKAALTEIGYDGYVTAEVIPYRPGRLEKTAEFMKKMFKS